MPRRARLAVWARFFRLRLLPTPLLNAMTGSIAAGALLVPPSRADICLATVVIAALYLLGMGANDLADRHRDRRDAPSRPLASGELTVRGATIAVFLAGSLAIAAAALLPASTRPFSVAALLTILIYNGWTKDHAWLGPLAMGGVRFLVVLFGAALVGEVRDGLLAALVIGGHGFWVTRFSLEEERARRDVLARRSLAVLAHTGAATALTVLFVSPPPVLLLAWILPAVFLGAAVRVRQEAAPGRFTFSALCAFPLLDGAVQLSYNSPVTSAVCVLTFLCLATGPLRSLAHRKPSE